MAHRPSRPCQKPGCSALAIEGASRCVLHHRAKVETERERLRIKSAQRSSSVRREVDARDQRVCQCCGATGVPTQKHHKIPLSKGGPDVAWNIITLCHRCHSAQHRAVSR